MYTETSVIKHFLRIVKPNVSFLSRNYNVLCAEANSTGRRFQSTTVNRNINGICINRRIKFSESILLIPRCASNNAQKIVQIQPATNAKKPKREAVNVPSRSAHTPPPPPPPEESEQSSFPWKYVAAALVVSGALGGAYYYQTKQPAVKVESKKKWKPRPVTRVPAELSSLPEKVKYVLVGGGTASFAAFRAIKSNDPKAQILVISEEDSLPYMRPPLSKEVWQNDSLDNIENLTFVQWNGNRRSIFYESTPFYNDPTTLTQQPNGGVGVARGYSVTRVEPAEHRVTVTDGKQSKTIEYEKCLIATGGKARNIPILEQSSPAVRDRTVLYHTIRHLEVLWARLEEAKDIVIVGGGFLGSELACALGRKYKESDKRIQQVFKEHGNMAHVLPAYLAQWTTGKVAKEGVNIIPETQIIKTEMVDNKVNLTLTNGSVLKADLVIVGSGCEPDTSLAKPSQLEVHPELGGFLVNAELEARTDLYVAGDVACFYDVRLGRRRTEHHDHAVVSGRLAGENMAGGHRHYEHQSMFWSDLGPDVGYEAIGIVDSNLATVGVFAERNISESKETAAKVEEHTESSTASAKETTLVEVKSATESQPSREYERGVVFYLRDRIIVGIVMWNLFNRMSVARQLLSEQTVYDDLNEVAKLFGLHEE